MLVCAKKTNPVGERKRRESVCKSEREREWVSDEREREERRGEEKTNISRIKYFIFFFCCDIE